MSLHGSLDGQLNSISRNPISRNRSHQVVALAGMCGLLALFACDDATSPEQDFTSAWRAADLEVNDLTKLEESPIGGDSCWSAKVDGIETVFCQYKNAGAAAKAHPAGLRHVGEHTGLALNQGRWMIVVVDRDNTDTRGKAINRITNTFLAHKRVQEKPKKTGEGDSKAKK